MIARGKEREKERHSDLWMDTRQCWKEKKAFSYEAQMIICILIILSTCGVCCPCHEWIFFSFFSRASLEGIIKRLVVFLFHMFMNWRWSNCLARVRCAVGWWYNFDETFPLWSLEWRVYDISRFNISKVTVVPKVKKLHYVKTSHMQQSKMQKKFEKLYDDFCFFWVDILSQI